jgi:hypothetical protein
MKKTHYLRFVIVVLFTTTGFLSVNAQDTSPKKAATDTVKAATPKAGGTANVMLNASSDNGPRAVNIGLPASVGGTVVLENGLPVTYDFMGQSPTTLWRQDAGIAKFGVLNVTETAILASDVGVSVSTFTNRGTDVFKGSATLTNNSFGLLRGDVGISGPLKNNLFYSLTAFVNMDPGTFHTNFSTYMDKTQIYKGVLNKRYSNGQIGVQYKYAYNATIGIKQNPYIYHQDGTVTGVSGFRIGLDSYLEQSGKLSVLNPLTNQKEVWDTMDDLSSTSHVVDIFGDHKFDNGMLLDYTVRYHYANSGLYNPYPGAIQSVTDFRNTDPSNVPNGARTYFYADNPNIPYEGLIQNGTMIASPSTRKDAVMARFELSKKTANHQWMVGLHNWYYNTDKATMATYSYKFEVAPNPRALGYDQWNANTRTWARVTDEYGSSSYNSALQYYNGVDNKLALVGSDKWTINNKLSLDFGARAEWQKIDGDWYTAADRDRDKKEGLYTTGSWVAGETTPIKEDMLLFTGTVSALYKAFRNAGFLGDAYYIQQASCKLSNYAGADDPNMVKMTVPGFSAGVYFNHPVISLVSKVTKISRTNFKNNSTFVYPVQGQFPDQKQTVTYDVSTIGWTTDLLLTPLKGFDLHFLLTLQNPKYENYDVVVNWPDGTTTEAHNSGNVPRSVSKTIVEIDPSYSWSKFRVWASARYFSQEYANYPNTLTFAGRWETFAGLSYRHDKNVDFSLNAVNLLQQSGAQGSISGANTTTAEEAKNFYDQPLCGTYIRPFTIEFKTRVRF